MKNLRILPHFITLRMAMAGLMVVAAGWLVFVWLFPVKDVRDEEKTQLRSELTHLLSAEELHWFTIASGLIHSDPDSTASIALYQIEILNSQQNSYKMIPFYNLLGILHLYSGDYEQAMRMFYHILEIGYHYKDKLHIAHAYNNAGLIKLRTNKHRDAVNYIQKAIELFDTIGDIRNRSFAENNLGGVYLDIHDSEKAAYYFQKAIRGFEEAEIQEGLPFVFNHLAMLQMADHQYDSAAVYFGKGIRIASEFENNYVLSHLLYERGNGHFMQKQFAVAIDDFLLSDSLGRMFHFASQSCQANLGLARSYLATALPGRAMEHALKANQLALEIQNEKLIYAVSEVMAQIFENKGDIDSAYHFMKLANESKSNFLAQSELAEVYGFEIDQLSRKMEKREFEMLREQLLLRKRKNNMSFLAVSAVLLAILLSLMYYIRINRINQMQKDKLNENTRRHAWEKNLAVMQAEMDERKRLGSDLHDGMGTLLSLTKLNLSSIADNDELSEDKKRDLLYKSLDNLDDIIQEVRIISHSMTPLVLTERGFREAVHDLIARLSQFSINLSINGLSDDLPLWLENALFRTLQEAITNIARHAACSEASIQIIQKSEDISMMIEDNGRGFSLQEQNSFSGMGLKNAASRIENLNGQFYIDSMPGRGTIVYVSIPFSINQNA